MSGRRGMVSSIALRAGLVVSLVAAVLVGSGLLIGSLVVALAPVLGLAWALASVGIAFFALAALLGVWNRALSRAAKKNRRTMATMGGLVELLLLVMPKPALRRLAAGVTAGIGLAALLALLLKPGSDKEN